MPFRLSRPAARVAIVCPAILLGGCVERTVSVDTTPMGSLVYLNGEEVGRTPLKRDFVWYGRYDIEVSHDGYNTIVTTAKLSPPVFQWIPFDLFAEILPFHFHDDQHLAYSLTPDVGALTPMDGAALAQRGEAMRAQLEGSRKPATLPVTRPATTKPKLPRRKPPATQPR